MTTTNPIATHSHVGDGTANAYAVQMAILADTDIIVYSVVIATEVATTLTLNVDYTLTRSTTFFLITPTASIAATVKWVIVRALPATQTLNLVDQNAFPPEAVEDEFDRLQHQINDLRAILDRCLKAPITDPAGLVYDIGRAVDRASKTAAYDASGNLTAVDVDGDTATLTASAFGQTVMDAASADAALNLHGLYRGTTASRPATPGYGEGSIHFASDDLIVSYYTSGAWQSVSGAVTGTRNLLPNGEFLVNQQVGPYTAASTPQLNSNGYYCFDQMVLLSDGNDIVDVSDETTDIPAGFSHACKMVVQTASKKFGLMLPLSNEESAVLLGGGTGVASLSFYAKSTQLTALRAEIWTWSGTVDAFTRASVGVWQASGTTPDPAANWVAENTSASHTISSTWTRFSASNIAIDSLSAANVALVILYPNTDASISDDLFVTGCQINEGATVAPFDHHSPAATLVDCLPYYQKSFNSTVRPVQNVGSSAGALYQARQTSTGSAYGGIHHYSAVPFHSTPSVTAYNPQSANTKWYAVGDGSDAGTSSIAAAGTSGFFIDMGSIAATASELFEIHWSAEAWLGV